MYEIYDKPITSSGIDHLAWATTPSGLLTSFTESRRLSGWQYNEVVPYDCLNYRWNLLGDWEQYCESTVQRRFENLFGGVAYTDEDDCYWVSTEDGTRQFGTQVARLENVEGSAEVFTLACDSEKVFFGAGTSALYAQAGYDDFETSTYEEVLSGVISDIEVNGAAVFATVSGTLVYKLSRVTSDDPTASASTNGGKVVSKVAANTTELAVWKGGQDSYIQVFDGITGTLSYVYESNTIDIVHDACFDDDYLYFCGDATIDGDEFNVIKNELDADTEVWNAFVPEGETNLNAYSICTDFERLYVLHDRTTYNIECLSSQTGEKLWSVDAFEAGSAPAILFVDDRYLYAATNKAEDNITFLIDKTNGHLLGRLETGYHATKDSDGYNLYSLDYINNELDYYVIADKPKQFVHVSGSTLKRKPFYKLALPM